MATAIDGRCHRYLGGLSSTMAPATVTADAQAGPPMKLRTTRRRLTHLPCYRRDRLSGLAVAAWKDKDGKRHSRRLPGPFNSPESRAAFERLRVDVKASARSRPAKAAPPTVAAVCAAYLRHAERYYRTPDGRPTSTVAHCKDVGQALCELYAHKPAAGFGPLMLKAALQRWADQRRTRSACNRRLCIAKRLFKWAVSEELVPATVYMGLVTVPGLQRGRTAATETDPVTPVDDATVDATLPLLNRHTRGLVEFQRLTSCRPGEACAVRLCDIDASGPVWLYTPGHHKTAHRGKARMIAVGPKAQAVLTGFATTDPTDFLFNPARAMAELRAGRSAARRTPRYPSHMARNKRKRKKAKERKRPPGERYTPDTYGGAVDRACDWAFPEPTGLSRRPGEMVKAWRLRLTDADRAKLEAWQKAHRWHPNQLRHTFATAVRREYGLEAAQALLGHERADVT